MCLISNSPLSCVCTPCPSLTLLVEFAVDPQFVHERTIFAPLARITDDDAHHSDTCVVLTPDGDLENPRVTGCDPTE